MNLPKKLTLCSSTNSFIVDENNKDVLLCYSDIYEPTVFREAVIKRYNSYTPIVIALTLVSTALVFALIALI
jgi:hypothetical protein